MKLCSPLIFKSRCNEGCGEEKLNFKKMFFIQLQLLAHYLKT